jgi:hypothetical protein
MESPIPIIIVGDPKFKEEVGHCIERKRNLIIVGSSEDEICQKISEIVSLNGYCPDKLNRWGIYALAEVLTPGDLNDLLQAERQKKAICIVEQIKLPGMKPPEVRPILIYSEPQGVIADFGTFEQAKSFLQKHRAPWNDLQRFPLAGIYEWQDGEWHQVRAFV